MIQFLFWVSGGLFGAELKDNSDNFYNFLMTTEYSEGAGYQTFQMIQLLF